MAGVAVRIAVLADAARAKAELNGVASVVDRVGSRARALRGPALAGLGALAIGALAAGKAAAADEAAQSRLAQSLRNGTQATAAQIAATEKWITKQGVAKGVADDDLRPAMARLALATGSVDKAQRLSSLAMDISAGSGKSLETVSTALAKAQTGNVGGLARLGVATKDASGKTLSLAQITDQLAKKYKGDAAAAAETTAGKQRRLTVQMGELQEEIGGKLLPVMVKLATTGLKVVGWIDKHQKTAGILLGVLAGLAVAVLAVNAAMALTGAVTTAASGAAAAYAAVQGLVSKAAIGTRIQLALLTAQELISSAASKAMAAAQWVLNAAMAANPITLVVLAIIALVAVFVLAWKKSETFRAIVTGAWNAIKAASAATWDWIKTKIGQVFGFLKNIFLNFTGPGLIIKHWNTIKNATVTAWNAVVTFVRNKINDLVNKVKSIKDSVTGVFSNAGSWLYNAGKKIIQGLLDGIKALFGKVKSKLKELTGLIPDWKGPAGTDARLLRPAGESIIQSLIDGFDRKIPAVRKTLVGLTKDIAGFGSSMDPTIRLDATAALTANQNAAFPPINVTLTAQQLDQLQRGRQIQMDLDAYANVGGRKRAT